MGELAAVAEAIDGRCADAEAGGDFTDL